MYNVNSKLDSFFGFLETTRRISTKRLCQLILQNNLSVIIKSH